MRAAFVPDAAVADGAVSDAALRLAPRDSSSSTTPPSPPAASLFNLTGVELGAILGVVGVIATITGLTIGLSRIPAIAKKVQPNLKARAKIRNKIDSIDKKTEKPDENAERTKANPQEEEEVQAEETQNAETHATAEGDILAADDAAATAGEEALET